MATANNGLREKTETYQRVRQNTISFRKAWEETVREMITRNLNEFLSDTGLSGKVVENTEMENLGSVTLDFGRSSSGIAHVMEAEDVRNVMIKYNGGLIYQQLFNGKIMVMVQPPHIEGYGERKEPRFVEIVTPEEIQATQIGVHLGIMLDVLTEWEDFDDEGPQKKTIFNPIGFQHAAPQAEIK